MMNRMFFATSISVGQISLFIMGALVIVVAATVYIAYSTISRRVKDFSRAAFGTEDLIKGFQNQQDELAMKPKSVTSMTRLMEPQIQRDFPEFSWDEFKRRAETMLVSALTAIAKGDVLLVKEASEELSEQIRARIANNESSNVKEHYDNIRIHQTEIANYVKANGTCTITIQSAVEYDYYKEREGKLLEGDKERKTQTKYNIELMYVQDASKVKFGNAVGATCPNCGAPITNLGHMVCEYCGAGVQLINTKVWNLNSFQEVDYKHV